MCLLEFSVSGAKWADDVQVPNLYLAKIIKKSRGFSLKTMPSTLSNCPKCDSDSSLSFITKAKGLIFLEV